MPDGSLERTADGPALVGTCATIIFPCLNEEQAVAQCVARALKVFAAAGIDGTVLVVDNGSTDGSVAEATAAGARVVRQTELGYGAALRSGIECAETELVLFADADGTYELEAIPRLLAPLVADEADIVLGTRLDAATHATMPLLHRFVGTPVLNKLVNRAGGAAAKIRDSQSGFRAMRRSQMLEIGMTWRAQAVVATTSA